MRLCGAISSLIGIWKRFFGCILIFMGVRFIEFCKFFLVNI